MKLVNSSISLAVLLAGGLVLSALRPAISRTMANAVMGADSVKHDPNTGLVADEHLTLVVAQCTACHSSKLILQNRFTRDGWKEKIRWMQRTQKLWDLGETEPVILDYLVKHYGPEQKTFDGRRKPLPAIQWYKL
ncbi:hypothetical protein [Larkinella rosea]|uniref:hypothetical protein n=1 Tax=Larkinella rosea TaxID=2025312 RepID=UPI001E55FCAD|nr:hypothetical protein [Larkinella rosea]